MARFPVIDADGHIIERIEEVREYLEAPFKNRGGPLLHSEPYDRGLYGTLPHNQQLIPECADASDWLRVMDESQIELAFLYPTAMGNVSRVLEADYAGALCRAYNRYVYDKFKKVSDRLNPIALVPFQDPVRAVEELRRAVSELGFRAAVTRTTGLQFPLGHRFYDPIYEEAQRLGCAIAVHGTNGAQELACGGFETFTEIHTVSFPVGVLAQFTSMIFQGVPERFPDLRLAFLEIGGTWLPYWLDRMDEHWELRGEVEAPHLKRAPSACVRQRGIYFSFETDETLLPETFKYVGEEHFVYASDIPHWDNEFPKNLQRLEAREDIAEEATRKLVYENARGLYGLA